MPRNKATPKYRPVLTAEQILHIIQLAKLEEPISMVSISLISTLSPFAAKIDNAGIVPAYSTSPVYKLSITDKTLSKLGAEVNQEIESMHLISKEERWAKAYAKRMLDPVSCSLVEIADAKSHAYLNDLMGSDELADYETAMVAEHTKIEAPIL